MQKELKGQIKDFIINTFLGGKGSIKEDESLFESGLIDSFGMLELVAFVQKKFGVSVKPSEVMIENFSCVNKIVQFIDKKQKGS
ncbi:MAG: acyl carrier protein [Candidatus Omnitrophica bacterium]|nr:acyl carrier protein [Candidatus Omnitrophota bacterium]